MDWWGITVNFDLFVELLVTLLEKFQLLVRKKGSVRIETRNFLHCEIKQSLIDDLVFRYPMTGGESLQRVIRDPG